MRPGRSVLLRVRSRHLNWPALQPRPCLFLNRAAVRRHITHSKPCQDSNPGYREILVEARAGDVMAGAGGAAGPAPDV